MPIRNSIFRKLEPATASTQTSGKCSMGTAYREGLISGLAAVRSGSTPIPRVSAPVSYRDRARRTAASPEIKPSRYAVPIEHLPDVCVEAVAGTSLRKMEFLIGIAHRNLVLARNLVVTSPLARALLSVDIALGTVEQIQLGDSPRS